MYLRSYTQTGDPADISVTVTRAVLAGDPSRNSMLRLMLQLNQEHKIIVSIPGGNFLEGGGTQVVHISTVC